MTRTVNPVGPSLSPGAPFLVVALAVAAGTSALGIWYAFPWFLGLLVGVNLATVMLYGYDKAVAGGKRARVPEWILHFLAISGGTPAAFASMMIFRHKTIKGSFRKAFWIIAALQAGIALAWFWCWMTRPPWIPAFLGFLFPEM